MDGYFYINSNSNDKVETFSTFGDIKDAKAREYIIKSKN